MAEHQNTRTSSSVIVVVGACQVLNHGCDQFDREASLARLSAQNTHTFSVRIITYLVKK